MMTTVSMAKTGVFNAAKLIFVTVVVYSETYCIARFLGTTTTGTVVTALVPPSMMVPITMNSCNSGVVRSLSLETPSVGSTSMRPLPSSASSRHSYISQTSIPRETRRTTTTTATALYSSIKSPFFNFNNNNKDDDKGTTTTIAPPFAGVTRQPEWNGTNIVYGIIWTMIVAVAFTDNSIVPHGSAVELYDAQLFQRILDNPISPTNVSALYAFAFNLFAIIPILLSCLILPIEEITTYYNNNNNGITKNMNGTPDNNKSDTAATISIVLPPQPFIIASAAIGYFAMGLYLSVQRSPTLLSTSSSSSLSKSTKRQQRTTKPNDTTSSSSSSSAFEFSWYTKNVWENSVLQWSIVAFIVYLSFGCQTISTITESGWDYLYHDFISFLSNSKFATISCIDLFCLHITCISLIPTDYAIRCRSSSSGTDNTNVTTTVDDDDNNNKQRGNQIAALAAFVPYLGTALYIALRPSLASVESKQ